MVEVQVCVRWNDRDWVCNLRRSIVGSRYELFQVEDLLVVVLRLLDEAVGVSESFGSDLSYIWCAVEPLR